MPKILQGTKPHQFDNRDHAFHKTFPQFGSVAPMVLELKEYNFDAGFGMNDQNAIDTRFTPNLAPGPYSCTGQTTTSIASDDDKVLYDPIYTYGRTCIMENHGPDQGCDIRNSMKSLTIYGLRKDGESSAQAIVRKRGKYFTIDKIPGRDWFDSYRLAMRGNGRGISIGVPWVVEFATPTPNGLVPATFGYDGNAEHYPWHDVKLSGEKTINGKPTIEVKSWQGPNYGREGWINWDRETFNRIADIYGTFSATPGLPVQPQDIAYVTGTIKQQIIDFLNMMVGILNLRIKNYA